MPIIEIKNYFFSYTGNDGREKEVLHDLCISIEEKTITGVLGLSGCGKTTLCKTLCGIIPHCCPGKIDGTILIDGVNTAEIPLNKLACRIGFVMQDPDEQLITTTVEDELAFAPENLKLAPCEINRRVNYVLDALGLKALRTCDPSHLSGGQKQLTAIGSILTLEPDILVLDEPMSHLDETGKQLLCGNTAFSSKQGENDRFGGT